MTIGKDFARVMREVKERLPNASPDTLATHAAIIVRDGLYSVERGGDVILSRHAAKLDPRLADVTLADTDASDEEKAKSAVALADRTRRINALEREERAHAASVYLASVDDAASKRAQLQARVSQLRDEADRLSGLASTGGEAPSEESEDERLETAQRNAEAMLADLASRGIV